jgi:hypothetical protein
VVATVAAVLRRRMRLRACLANVLRAWGDGSRPGALDRLLGALCVGAGLIADAVALSSAMRSFSIGSERSATLFSMAS